VSGEAGLPRRAAVEAVGTATLVVVVVGSGIQATRLTGDVALELLANSTATVLGLAVLIAVLGPISGAHLNPAVTLVAWWSQRHVRPGLRLREPAAYVALQIVGATAGAVLANAMFGLPLVQLSTHARTGGPLWLGEVVATAGLIVVVFGLARTGREGWAPPAVACYIGAAFVAAQLVGALAGAALLVALFGRPLPRVGDVVLSHPSPDSPGSQEPAVDVPLSWPAAERIPER
jgi:glycerol uptake facilitator-like aquaporin